MKRRLLATGLLLVGVLLLTNCSRLSYVGQAAWGQGRILMARQPIDRLMADPLTPEELKSQLELVTRIREFAVEELQLPAGASYSSYVELPATKDGARRTAVVWNVVAAPELSIAPLTWCFPVAGCVSYRGYFNEARARRFGDRLKAQGYDVSVGGAAAYSTLGWFEDPVLSTVIDYPEVYLAGLIFHELAHRLFYVQDDTRFNESFATAVEIEGVRRWLEAAHEPAASMVDYLAQQRAREEVAELLLKFRDRLAEELASDRSDEWKRQRKREIFEQLQEALRSLEAPEGGSNARAGGWAQRLLNNADLASAADYHGLVAGFRGLLERHEGDLPSFYDAARQLAKFPVEERGRQLSEESPAERRSSDL